MITIVRADLFTRSDELLHLFDIHHKETCIHPDLFKLNVNIAGYKQLEESGILLSIAVLDADEIIGYSVGLLSQPLHHQDVLCYHNDSIFIHPLYRGEKLGVALINATEKAAKEDGARLILWQTKKDSLLSTFLPSLGYEPQEVVLSKRL